MARRFALAAVAALALATSSTTGRQTNTTIGDVRPAYGGVVRLSVTDSGTGSRSAHIIASDRHAVRIVSLTLSPGDLRLLRRYIDETMAELEKPPEPAPAASAATQ